MWATGRTGKNLSFSGLQAKFQGRSVALSYFRLWHLTAILRRRIDSFQVVDRAIVERRRTYDINLPALQGMVLLDRNLLKFKIVDPPSGRKVLIPIMKVPKELFSNVDTESGSGRALHLCRKHVNVQVVAHIIVGICSVSGMDQLGDEPVFHSAVQYLYSDSGNGTRAIQKLALNHGIQSTDMLDFFLSDLQPLYIQCIEIDPHDPECEIIKIRSTMASDVPERGNPTLNRSEMSSKQVKGAELPGPSQKSLNTFTYIRHFFRFKLLIMMRSFISTSLDLSGIKATRLEIKDPPIGEGVHPTHMRIISPPGTLIDDVDIIRRSDNKLLVSHPKVGIFFRQDRAIIWDSGLGLGEYAVRLKVNPKRGSFLIPAALGMFTQMLLAILCLALGPVSLVRNDASLGGALLVLPSFLAFFASRDTEHELLSRMLSLPRLLTVLSAISSIICGALVFALPDKPGNSHVLAVLFSFLFSTLYLSSTTFGLLIFQISRISLIRSLLGPVKRKSSAKKSPYIQFSKERLENPVCIVIFVALFILLMVTLYTFPATYLLELFGSKWNIN